MSSLQNKLGKWSSKLTFSVSMVFRCHRPVAQICSRCPVEALLRDLAPVSATKGF